MKFSVAFLCFVALSSTVCAKFVDDPYYVAMEDREIRYQNQQLSILEFKCRDIQNAIAKARAEYNKWGGARSPRYYKAPSAAARKKQNIRLQEIARLRRTNPKQAAELQKRHDQLCNQELRTDFVMVRYIDRSRGDSPRDWAGRRLHAAIVFGRECPAKIAAQTRYIKELKARIDLVRERRREAEESDADN